MPGVFSTVFIDRVPYELDYYGFIVGAELTDNFQTELGLMECRLKRRIHNNQFIIEADLRQSANMIGIENTYTTFSAGLEMKKQGDRYVIETRAYKNVNDLWRQIEIQISNLILINE